MCPIEISVSDSEIVFEIDLAQFMILPGSDELDMPWRFEILN